MAVKHCSLGYWIHTWNFLPMGEETRVELDLVTHVGTVTPDATFAEAQQLLDAALADHVAVLPMASKLPMVGSVS